MVFVYILLILFGITPYPLGCWFNDYIMSIPDTMPPFEAIGLGLLAVWALVAFACNRGGKHTRAIVLCMNAVPLVDLVLLAIQLGIRHAYWAGAWGIGTQFFYLPLLRLSFMLTPRAHTMLPTYVVAFVLLVLASYGGCKLRQYLAKKTAS